MTAEAFCIFMIVVALVSGNASAQLAANACFEGTWAVDFWVGTVAIGFGTPLVLAWVKESSMTFYVSAMASIGGMMCLHLFILYARQMNPVL